MRLVAFRKHLTVNKIERRTYVLIAVSGGKRICQAALSEKPDRSLKFNKLDK